MTDATNISAPRPILKLESESALKKQVVDCENDDVYIRELARLRNSGWRVMAVNITGNASYQIIAYSDFN